MNVICIPILMAKENTGVQTEEECDDLQEMPWTQYKIHSLFDKTIG